MDGLAFIGDPRSAALWNPWGAPAPVSPFGAPLGVELHTHRALWWHPWYMQHRRIIPSTVGSVEALKNAGKTALMIALGLRTMQLQAGVYDGTHRDMRTLINSRKQEDGADEYSKMTEYLYSPTYNLNQAASINPIDERMYRDNEGNIDELSLLEVLVNICELLKVDPLINHEPLVLQVAVHKVVKQLQGIMSPDVLDVVIRGLSMDDLTDYFFDSNEQLMQRFKAELKDRPEMLKTLQLALERPPNIDEVEFRADAGRVAGYMSRMLRLDYGHIFGGNNSIYDILAQPVSTLNWSGVPDKARTLLEALFFKWEVMALSRGDMSLIPHIKLNDEEGEGITNLMHARFFSQYVNKARGQHTFDLRAFQSGLQLTQVGAAGSELRSLAENIERGMSFHLIGQQQASDGASLHRLSQLGLSDQDVMYSTVLDVGQFGLVVPHREFPVTWFQLALYPTERRLIEGNAASKKMLAMIPALSLGEFQRRSELIGAKVFGHTSSGGQEISLVKSSRVG